MPHAPGKRASAAVLEERREEILETWEHRVRASATAPRLDGPALRDHVTEILDRVASLLSPSAPVDGDPREHGRTRAAQGVSIPAVLAELGILRRVVLEVWGGDGGLDPEAVRTLDRVVDEAALEAARRITAAHDAFFRGIDAISRASLESRDTEDLLRRLLAEIVRTEGDVDAAAIFLREGDRLVLRAAAGPLDEAELGRSFRRGDGFVGKIAQEACPLVVEDASLDAALSAELPPGSGIRALYGIPLVHQAEVIGVAYMASLRATGLGPEDRRLFESMASRAALAVGRQLAIDQERRHREELALLSRVSRDLVERMDLPERLRRAVESLVPGFADLAALVLTTPEGEQHVAVHAGDAEATALIRGLLEPPLDASAARGIARVVRDGVPELVPDLEAELERSSGLGEAARAALARLGARSYLAVPLSTPQGTTGALSLATTRPGRRFDERALELALELGRRIGVAVENARLFEKARREALLREQVLAVVSHDLRNPLSAVLMAAGRIEASSGGSGPERHAILRVTEAIRRAARRMERLIADLVDVAAIQSGHLSIERQARGPGELVRETVDAMQGIAHERGIALTASASPDLPAVLADRDRILQVLGNLVSNALDVTPAGGRVDLRADPASGSVRFSVSDTGPGIPAEEARHVFEPYRRGASPGYKGTGLGLAIARGMVVAHGGRIGVETAPGSGATFWFTIPTTGGAPAAGRGPERPAASTP